MYKRIYYFIYFFFEGFLLIGFEGVKRNDSYILFFRSYNRKEESRL